MTTTPRHRNHSGEFRVALHTNTISMINTMQRVTGKDKGSIVDEAVAQLFKKEKDKILSELETIRERVEDDVYLEHVR